MLFSASAKSAGASGFFFEDDAKAPSDAFSVPDSVALAAANRPEGFDFTVSRAGDLSIISPPQSALVARAREAKLQELQQAYLVAVAASVSFTTAAGVSAMFQADDVSIQNLQRSILGCVALQATPTGFFWVADDNTRVPFTYADLTGMAAAIFARAAGAFQRLQERKVAARSASTVAAVNAVVW